MNLISILKSFVKTKSWCSDDPCTNNRHQQLNYVSIYQVRKNGKTDHDITIFIHKGLIYNIRHDLSVNNDTEAYCLKIKNSFKRTIYRQPSEIKKNLKSI